MPAPAPTEGTISSDPAVPLQPTPPPEPSGGRNLPLAIVTGLALAGMLFGSIFWSPAAFLAVVSAVVLVAQFELYGALAQRGLRPARLLGAAGGLVLTIGAYARGPQAMSFGLAILVAATFLWYLSDPDRDRVTLNVAATLFGLLYVPFLGAFVVLMRRLPDGTALTLAYIGAVAFYDIGAYAAGSLFGRRRIAPTISPSKTWEGAAGATLFVFALALAIGPHLGPLDLASSAALAGVASVTAPLGDFAESLIKRDLGIKDMGTLLPGHGGVLDRIDALLLTAPAAYWLMRALVL